MKKEWKDIKDYEGLYKVSNYGEVYSVKRGRCLNPREAGGGYLRVQLSKNGKITQPSVHRLVLMNFTQKSEWKDIPNHLDFNPKNNKLDNLEWATRSENARYRKDNYTNITENLISNIRNEYKNGDTTFLKISNKYKISESMVNKIIRNKSHYNKNYTPPVIIKSSRKFSYELINIIQDLYFIYNVRLTNICNLLNIKRHTVANYIYNKNKYKPIKVIK